MGIGESVKKGFAVAGKSAALVLVLFAFWMVWNLVSVAVTPPITGAAEVVPPVGASPAAVLAGLVFMFAHVYIQAGLLGYVGQKMKTGEASLPVFFSAGARYYLRVLLFGLLVFVTLGAFILAATVLIALLAGALDILAVILWAIVAAIGIYSAMLMFLAPYFIVVGGEKIIQSIKNSIGLVRKNLLVVLGIILIIIIIVALSFAALLLAAYLLTSLGVRGTASLVVLSVLGSFFNAFLSVLVVGALMNFYLKASANTGGAE